jgi:hypothetical protein
MADASYTADNIKVMEGAVTRHFIAGEALALGDWVYIASDGEVEKADANAAATAEGAGLVVGCVDDTGASAAGDPVTVCVFGPVAGFSSLNEGTVYFTSANAGKIADAAPSGAGSWTNGAGRAERADVFFVQPGLRAATSNS